MPTNEHARFNIPPKCYIRWQAALAVVEDLLEDTKAPFSMMTWANESTRWNGPENEQEEEQNFCGTPACFAGYMSVAPYCKDLEFPLHNWGSAAGRWLLANYHTVALDGYNSMHGLFFSTYIGNGMTREGTLELLQKRLKSVFHASTGGELVALESYYTDYFDESVPLK